MARPLIDKEELPLASEAEIARVVADFENCTLSYRHWTHRAHLAVAVTYLRKYSPEESLSKMRTAINRYNSLCGDPDGYSETITRLFLKKIDADMQNGRSKPALPDEIARLAGACSVDWLYRYYSRELIWSGQAKTGWVQPDIRPLDFNSGSI